MREKLHPEVLLFHRALCSRSVRLAPMQIYPLAGVSQLHGARVALHPVSVAQTMVMLSLVPGNSSLQRPHKH